MVNEVNAVIGLKSSADLSGPKVAVLIPCFNEGAAIAAVVGDLKSALPQSIIYVYDNNSDDDTAERARSAGARVYRENRQGKGFVVRRMFSDVEADIYVLIDGDATYDAPSAPRMIEKLIEERLDMVVATRVHKEQSAYRSGHVVGNKLLTGFVSWMFGRRFTDMLSGYRVFSRRYVKSFPVLSSGFEIETEFTVHALELGLPVGEIATPYWSRLEGSESKLNTWSDGFRILCTILNLYRSERPLIFFSVLGVLLGVFSVLLASPIVVTYLETGLVPRFPTAILSVGIMLVAFVAITCGLVLDTVTRGRRELKLLAYLTYGAPGEERRS